MSDPVRYDAVIIGGGPAGIFAAYSLICAGCKTLLVEAGTPMRQSLCPRVRVGLDGRLVRESERFRMQCPRCTCLTGLGGAAFHFDTNLGYPAALSRSKIERGNSGEVHAFSSLERTLGPFERAQRFVQEVFLTLRRHGLQPQVPAGCATAPAASRLSQVFASTDLTASQSITLTEALEVIDALVNSVVAAGGELRFGTRAESITHGAATRFVVELTGLDGGPTEVAADNVVVAVGKLGLAWVREVISRLGLAHRPATRVDVGVRLEGPRERLAPLSADCANPKLAYLNSHGESVRTFCVCPGGRIMQYAFADAVVLDGQHCLTKPTSRSNFGVVSTLDVPVGYDGTDYAIDIARTVTTRGGGKPVACTLGQLRGASSRSRPRAEVLDTSLTDYRHESLDACLPRQLVDDVLGMVSRLNATYPGILDHDTVVAAPVIERIYPQLTLSGGMESSQPGLYFVGDASSKIIGVTYGAATGIAAAEDIVAGMDRCQTHPAAAKGGGRRDVGRHG